jgi:hypothetical protein
MPSVHFEHEVPSGEYLGSPPHLLSLHLLSPHLPFSRLSSAYLTSQRLSLPHLPSPRLSLSHLPSPRLSLSHLPSPRLSPSHLGRIMPSFRSRRVPSQLRRTGARRSSSGMSRVSEGPEFGSRRVMGLMFFLAAMPICRLFSLYISKLHSSAAQGVSVRRHINFVLIYSTYTNNILCSATKNDTDFMPFRGRTDSLEINVTN